MFLSFVKKYKKKLLDTVLDSLKTATKKVVYTTGKFFGKKIPEAVTQTSGNKIVKQEPIEETLIQQEEILSNGIL